MVATVALVAAIAASRLQVAVEVLGEGSHTLDHMGEEGLEVGLDDRQVLSGEICDLLDVPALLLHAQAASVEAEERLHDVGAAVVPAVRAPERGANRAFGTLHAGQDRVAVASIPELDVRITRRVLPGLA